ncbi:hypothetical protein EYC84_009575 [Monilinia fructicola]|uniref:Uncharacterized protein n=1 Tax=Monilinia fructicola TaxID=38448 RepID=A0A5M9JCW5_MONFR|nr:hypothetical protein EYC84_009575 [Monilinia fructicola]
MLRNQRSNSSPIPSHSPVTLNPSSVPTQLHWNSTLRSMRVLQNTTTLRRALNLILRKVHFLKTDFDKWVDEDEQDEAPEEDLSQMNGMGKWNARYG